MPVVTIEMLEGRTIKQKRELVRTVTSAVAKAVGCLKEDVSIIIRDMPRTNWATGGELSSDKLPGK